MDKIFILSCVAVLLLTACDTKSSTDTNINTETETATPSTATASATDVEGSDAGDGEDVSENTTTTTTSSSTGNDTETNNTTSSSVSDTTSENTNTNTNTNTNATSTQTTSISLSPAGFDLTNLNAGYPVDAALFYFSSAFGPRLKASDSYRYDFHRGIDIPGTLGQSIYSISNGTLYKAYPEGSSAYPSGGNVIVIRHDLATPIVFHGTSVTRFYSVYMHLQSFGAAAQNYLSTGTQANISQGELIGAMGQSGDTNFTHLHFEIRLQTTCSLEYQIANPTQSCAQYGFDPHVNPLGLYLKNINSDTYSIAFQSVSATQAEIRVTTTPLLLNIDGIEFKIFSDAELTQEVYSKTASFNTRESFDATSTAALDTANIDGFTVSPDAFNASSDSFGMNFTASISDTLWTNHDALFVQTILLTTEGEIKSASTQINNP